MSFDTSIFINCPFDNAYRPLLRALIFITLYFEFEPKIAKTVSSGKIRINEITGLIEGSKYSIHDISRSEFLKGNELPRFNMPYEMGIDIGCSLFGSAEQRTKECLILEKIKNRYDGVISDISGQDIKSHNNKVKKIIQAVIDWFAANEAVPAAAIPAVSVALAKFEECTGKIAVALAAEGYNETEIKNLPVPQYIHAMKSALQ